MWLSYPKIKLILLGVLVIFSLVKITRLKIDYDIKQFFPKNDPEIKRYEEYVDDFGSDEQLLMIAIERKSGIFDSAFLESIKQFSDSCKNIRGIKNIVSLVTLKDLVKSPFGLLPAPLLNYSDKERLIRGSRELLNNEIWKGWLCSEKGDAIIVYVETDKELSNKGKTFVVNELKRKLNDFDFESYHLAGPLYTEVYYLKMTFFETAKSILTCTIIVIILIVLLFKTFKKIAIILSSLFLGMILFYGLLGAINEPLNVLSTLFPTLVVVVAVSDLIHFMTKFEYEFQNSTSIKSALLKSLKEISVTLFVTSLTTMIGLLSFATSGIRPVKEFAILGAAGVLIAFLIAIFVFPILILTSGIKNKVIKIESSRWLLWLERIYKIGKERSRFVLIVFAIAVIISGVGISKLSLNSNLMSAIMNHSPLKKDFRYFEENLHGARALEIIVNIRDPYKIQEIQTLKEIEKLEDYLSSIEFVGDLISPVDNFKYMNSVYYPNAQGNYILPVKQEDADKYFKNIVSLPQVINGKILRGDKNIARIYGKMNDIGASEMKQFIASTRKWIGENIDERIITVDFTGSALLIDKMNLSLVNSMFQSLIIAFSLVSLIVVLLFKKIRYIVISLIPNIIPLVMVGGILGIFSIEITGAMALIFTLGFVIAVDDTIHFLSKYRYELNKNRSSEIAIKNTIFTTGKAIIISSLVLAVGYMSIIISESRESFFHGLLISVTLIFALIADLFLLPVLIRKIDVRN